jgi:hypothetical protein
MRPPTYGLNPDGRSGNHRAEGFLIGVGNGIAAGSEIANAHILDLALTEWALLGRPAQENMRGRGLPEVCREPRARVTASAGRNPPTLPPP